VLSVALVTLLLATCTSGSPEGPRPSPSPASEEPWRGGTLRVFSALWPVSLIDPREFGYAGLHWELYRCCLMRTLMSYEAVSAAEGGTMARPDLASNEPDVSADGLTWTFHLREGLRYAPPFEDTEIVARDVVRALERLGSPAMPSESYSFYFTVIEGFEAFHAGETDTISGLETPDDHTLVVHLTEPSGDLAYRFTMVGTAPIPAGATDGHDDDYARFLVATGPYMIEGAGDLDFSLPPQEQEPVSGFVPKERMTLVRNPSWDPTQDPLRPAYVDRIELELVPMPHLLDEEVTREVGERIDDGSLDLTGAEVYGGQIDRYLSDPELRDRVVDVPEGTITYMPLNIAVPPFDDVHVRRAVNLAIDVSEIARRFASQSGDYGYTPVWHLMPDAVEGALIPAGWRPGWASDTSGDADLAAARAEMARSRYDADGDGICDAAACRDVLALVETKGFEFDYSWWWTLVRDALEQIGIQLERATYPCWHATRVDVLEKLADPRTAYGIGLSWCAGWGPDFPDGSTFIPLFDSSGLHDGANQNASLLGASPEQLGSWGYDVTRVPSVDERIDACMALLGAEHTECWARLDQYLSQEIVPWVPLLTTSRRFILGERVDHVSVIVQWARPALDQISLVPGSD
jgi:peptide/nickel transport system substrate-binding protein